MREQVELEIIVDSLRCVGIDVTPKTVARWSIATRAAVEQWAIRKRWNALRDAKKRLPCREAWQHLDLPKKPAVIRKYKVDHGIAN